MSDVDFRMLQTQLTDFTLLVRTNRADCEKRLARVAHDRLLDRLDRVIDTCRTAAAITLRLQRDIDEAMRDELEFALGDCMADLESSGRGASPAPLLDEIIDNPDTGEVLHPLYGVWCKRGVLDALEATDADLNGLRTIIDRIAAETRIRFSAYLCDAQDAGPDAPVYILRNGGRYREAV